MLNMTYDVPFGHRSQCIFEDCFCRGREPGHVQSYIDHKR